MWQPGPILPILYWTVCMKYHSCVGMKWHLEVCGPTWEQRAISGRIRPKRFSTLWYSQQSYGRWCRNKSREWGCSSVETLPLLSSAEMNKNKKNDKILKSVKYGALYMTYMAGNRKWFVQSMLGHWFTVPNHISVKNCLKLQHTPVFPAVWRLNRRIMSSSLAWSIQWVLVSI